MSRLVLLVSNDLLLQSQLSHSASSAGCELRVISPALLPDTSLGEQARLAALDLSAADDIVQLIDSVRFSGIARIWAFGPHVHADRLKAARAAGCEWVTTRGEFVRTAAERFAGLENA